MNKENEMVVVTYPVKVEIFKQFTTTLTGMIYPIMLLLTE